MAVAARDTFHPFNMLPTDRFEWYETGLPWNTINDLKGQLEKQPTFVACECIFIVIGIVSFMHAASNGKR